MDKELLSISEMAKLRHMTPETLRHYDRIGLIKPHVIDPSTGYRYYSIHQYEVLGTIRELKEIGLSLKEIRSFLEERNVEQSLHIMKAHQKKLQLKIEQLVRIESSLSQKMNDLRRISTEGATAEPHIRRIPERYFLTTNRTVTNDIELSYAAIEIERLLMQNVSLVAGSFLGLFFEASLQKGLEDKLAATLVAQTSFPNDYSKEDLIQVPSGTYVCLRHFGEVWDRNTCLSQMMEYIEREGMKIVGHAIQMVEVDVSVTDRLEESLFEIQIQIAVK